MTKATTEGRSVPAIEVSDFGDSYVLTTAIPGVRAEEIEVSVEGSCLTVGGTRPSGRFVRSLVLPRGTYLDLASARIDAGLLSIVIPKSPRVRPRIAAGSPIPA